jgi:hypothetical protein
MVVRDAHRGCDAWWPRDPPQDLRSIERGFHTPKVEYIEFFAEDAASGKPLYEEYVPGK